MTDKQKILIDAGPSRRGWHRLESVLRCPQYFAYKHVLNQSQDESFDRTALVRGSIGHVGLAHFYARKRAKQLKQDPEIYYTPEQAMEIAARKMGAAPALLVIARATVLSYLSFYATDTFKVLQVEREAEGLFRHGDRGPHAYTARLDLEYADSAGMVWFMDHKFVSRIQHQTAERYKLSGQFLGQRWLGQGLYGRKFGGVVLNLIQVEPHPRFERVAIPPAPGMMAKFPQLVCDAEERIEQLSSRDPWLYPAAASEQTCMTAYGPCPFVEQCQFGP